ncbi:MAG: peptidoglycan recognition family protein [Planctomycetota bacterium]
MLGTAHARSRALLFLAAGLVAVTGCAGTRPAPPPADASTPHAVRRIGDRLPRRGEEIVVAGQLFHVGAPVVLWLDADGYDAYRPYPHFREVESEVDEAPRSGARRLRPDGSEPTAADERDARNGRWSLDELRAVVDQFVIHFDACGTSETCFRVLQDERRLSVHFMLDVDGTIYQTLDLDERAWHATIANDRSIGVEIAQPGAVPVAERARLDEWYTTDASGRTSVRLPERFGDGGLRDRGASLELARPSPVEGVVNGTRLVQYDFTEAQYESLAKLTAALHVALPRIELDCPRDARGAPLLRTLSPEEFASFSGLLGHYHVQTNKVDPGPAFDWERVLGDARAILGVGTRDSRRVDDGA